MENEKKKKHPFIGKKIVDPMEQREYQIIKTYGWNKI
jgi:hypothetical protein